MQRYNIVSTVGDGSFGSVCKAVCLRTGDLVAIKKLKSRVPTWAEALAQREVAALVKLRHENIIRLRELIYTREENSLAFVFEFAHANLYSLMQARRVPPPLSVGAPPYGAGGFTEDEVRVITGQLLRALGHMHKHGFFHRDVKPENILISNLNAASTVPVGGAAITFPPPERLPPSAPNPVLVFKLCDFGQARETRSRPPYTDYVSTRWYRAPEVIVSMPNYNSPIDLWAAGAVMVELITGRPVFPGTSAMNQLFAISAQLGAPTTATWPEGVRLMAARGIRIPGASGASAVSASSLAGGVSGSSGVGGAASDYSLPLSIASAGNLPAAVVAAAAAAAVAPPPPPLASLLQSCGASEEAIDVALALLQWNPSARPSANDALTMPFFRSFMAAIEERDARMPLATPAAATLYDDTNAAGSGVSPADTPVPDADGAPDVSASRHTTLGTPHSFSGNHAVYAAADAAVVAPSAYNASAKRTTPVPVPTPNTDIDDDLRSLNLIDDDMPAKHVAGSARANSRPSATPIASNSVRRAAVTNSGGLPVCDTLPGGAGLPPAAPGSRRTSLTSGEEMVACGRASVGAASGKPLHEFDEPDAPPSQKTSPRRTSSNSRRGGDGGAGAQRAAPALLQARDSIDADLEELGLAGGNSPIRSRPSGVGASAFREAKSVESEGSGARTRHEWDAESPPHKSSDTLRRSRSDEELAGQASSSRAPGSSATANTAARCPAASDAEGAAPVSPRSPAQGAESGASDSPGSASSSGKGNGFFTSIMSSLRRKGGTNSERPHASVADSAAVIESTPVRAVGAGAPRECSPGLSPLLRETEQALAFSAHASRAQDRPSAHTSGAGGVGGSASSGGAMLPPYRAGVPSASKPAVAPVSNPTVDDLLAELGDI